MNQQIFVYKDGQQYGPFTPQEAWEMVLKGEFNPETDSAWHEGISDWLPLKEVILQVAPPAQQAKVEPTESPKEQPTAPLKTKATSAKPKVVGGVLIGVVFLIAVGIGLSNWSSAQTTASVFPASTTNSSPQPTITQAVTNTPSVADYYGEYSGHTDAYNVKNKDGNDVTKNGSPITIPAFDTTVKFTSNGIEVSEINDNADIISMLSQGDVHVNAIDGNSVTISVNVAQSLNAKLSPSKPSYQFVFNKNGTGKMIPLSEQNAPIINLLSKQASTKHQSSSPSNNSSTANSSQDGSNPPNVPNGDNYYYEHKRTDGTTDAIVILTKTNTDFYLTISRTITDGVQTPYYVTQMKVNNMNETSDQIDYGQLSCQIVGDTSQIKEPDKGLVYTKSNDSFTLTWANGNKTTLTKSEPSDLQSCLTKSKALLVEYNKVNPPEQTPQPNSPTQNDPKALIGTWAYSFGQDGSTTTIRLSIHSDGTYELSCPGNGGDSYAHGVWRIRENGTVALDELVGDGTVPVKGDECSFPKNGMIQLNTGHLQKNIFLQRE